LLTVEFRRKGERNWCDFGRPAAGELKKKKKDVTFVEKAKFSNYEFSSFLYRNGGSSLTR
jgi:hypothetical protein